MSSYSPAGVQVHGHGAETLAFALAWTSATGCQRAAARRPDRIAVEAPDEAVTLRRAAAARRARGRRAAHARRAPRRPVALTLRAGARLRRGACTPACWPARAAVPIDPRLAERERGATCATSRSRRRPLRGDPACSSCRTARARRRRARRPHLGHDRRAAAGRADLRQHPRQRARLAQALGLGDDERWLCPLPLSPRRRPDGAAALGADGDDRRARRRRSTPAREHCATAITLASLVPTQLARLLDAGAQPPRAARGAARRRARCRPRCSQRARDAGWPGRARPTASPRPARTVTVGEPGDVETSGRALPGVGVAIAPDGEILVAGPTVARGGSAAHRRPRPARRPRPPDRHRPQGRHDRHRRRERRAGRGRGRAARAPGRRRGRRLRPPAPGVGRGGHRARRAARRAPSRPRRAARALPRAARRASRSRRRSSSPTRCRAPRPASCCRTTCASVRR